MASAAIGNAAVAPGSFTAWRQPARLLRQRHPGAKAAVIRVDGERDGHHCERGRGRFRLHEAGEAGSGRATAITVAATRPVIGPPASRPQTYAARIATSVTTASPVRTPLTSYRTGTRRQRATDTSPAVDRGRRHGREPVRVATRRGSRGSSPHRSLGTCGDRARRTRRGQRRVRVRRFGNQRQPHGTRDPRKSRDECAHSFGSSEGGSARRGIGSCSKPWSSRTR
jgi:hypothetical protein